MVTVSAYEGAVGVFRLGLIVSECVSNPAACCAERRPVEALGVGADHGPVDAAISAFVDRAVAVDEEVVPDVVPAVGPHVVGVDAPDV